MRGARPQPRHNTPRCRAPPTSQGWDASRARPSAHTHSTPGPSRARAPAQPAATQLHLPHPGPACRADSLPALPPVCVPRRRRRSRRTRRCAGAGGLPAAVLHPRTAATRRQPGSRPPSALDTRSPCRACSPPPLVHPTVHQLTSASPPACPQLESDEEEGAGHKRKRADSDGAARARARLLAPGAAAARPRRPLAAALLACGAGPPCSTHLLPPPAPDTSPPCRRGLRGGGRRGGGRVGGGRRRASPPVPSPLHPPAPRHPRPPAPGSQLIRTPLGSTATARLGAPPPACPPHHVYAACPLPCIPPTDCGPPPSRCCPHF